jgi:hypothetical protein
MGLKDRCNLQFDGGAGVLGQLYVVLFASKLINDVVARESIFKDLLCGAGLLSLGLSGLRSFHLVASDGAAISMANFRVCMTSKSEACVK